MFLWILQTANKNFHPSTTLIHFMQLIQHGRHMMQMSYRRHLHSWVQPVREELTEIKQSIIFFLHYLISSHILPQFSIHAVVLRNAGLSALYHLLSC